MTSTDSSLLKLIDEALSFIESSCSCGRVIFITGRSSAGKTTLGAAFKTLDDCIHFDVDQFAYGNDPVIDAGQPIRGSDKEKRSAELREAYASACDKGYKALFAGESPPLSVWTPFYSMVLARVKQARAQYGSKHVVVTHSVYLRAVRDYVRDAFAGDVTFVILNTSRDLLSDRAVNKIHELAARVNVSPQQYLDEHATGTTVEGQRKSIQMVANGFETKQEDEPNTFQIDVMDETMDKTDVFNVARKLLFT